MTECMHLVRATRSAEMDDINRQIDTVQQQIEDAGEWDLRAEKARLNSIIHGDNWDNFSPLPTPKEMKRVQALWKERSAWDNALLEATQPPEALGWRRLRHPWEQTGAGKRMSLETPTVMGAKADELGVLQVHGVLQDVGQRPRPARATDPEDDAPMGFWRT